MNAVYRFACATLVLVACGPIAEPTEPAPDRGHVIELGSQLIDTRVAPEALASTGGYAIVKFPGPVTAEQLQALGAAATVYSYLPHDAFLVRPADGAGLAAARAIGASWTGAYLPAYKVSRSAAELAQQAPAEVHTVMVTAFPDADLSRVVAAANLPGAEVVGSDRGARHARVRLRVDGAALADATAALAALPDVFWVDVEGRRELLNDTTVWVGQSGLEAGQTTPIFDHGIHGEGQIVGYIDTGIDADSCYFRDPARGLPPVNACGGVATDPAQRKVVAVDFLTQSECDGGIAANEWDTQNHGSHVAGTIAGDNIASPVAHDAGDGMAPAAKLVVQDGGFRTDNCGDLPGIGCPVVDLKPLFLQAYTQGARIHTNSWGDNENAFLQNNYSAACQDVDEFMFNHPDFLILFAAGNSGPRAASVGSPSTAKNGISVGATLRGTQASAMAGFSSCGPAADGRLKPDLTMPGSRIVSARNDGNVASGNCNQIQMSGTSMASPGAAGMAALVRQYYTEGHYPTGAPVAADGFTPSAALIKATMLNSTQSMTGAGPVPDACQGWGRVLLDNALYFTGQPRQLIALDDPGFAQGAAGQTATYVVEVFAGEPLRVTLGWTDFPSMPAASVNLNNDLDLEVFGPSGTLLGNVFAAGESASGGAADRRNNVEQVFVAAPAPGTYTITVRAFNVPSSAQPFALVVSGSVDRAPLANAGPDATVSPGAEVTLDGSASSDPDHNALSFAWTQTAGPPATLGDPSAAVTGFTPSENGTYAFQLSVSDGRVSTKDVVVVRVADVKVLFADDFELDRGWRRNPTGKDTATTGVWERADPEPTDNAGAKQLGSAVSGRFDLVTGALAAGGAGANDVDGGATSIQSPVIAIPAEGKVALSLSYYFAHANNASAEDFFRVSIVGDTTAVVIEELGSASNADAVFVARTVDLTAFAGQSVRIVIEAADFEGASLVEAAVDDVVIRQQ